MPTVQSNQPSSQLPPLVTEVVKELRLALGDTQQQFAQRLGTAISTVVRYESTRAPRGPVLTKLVRLALDNGFRAIALRFQIAVNYEVAGRAYYWFPEIRNRLFALTLILLDTKTDDHLKVENARMAVSSLLGMVNAVDHEAVIEDEAREPEPQAQRIRDPLASRQAELETALKQLRAAEPDIYGQAFGTEKPSGGGEVKKDRKRGK